jgi:phosphatidylinositol alpha-1,6-mannosyltransferase
VQRVGKSFLGAATLETGNGGIARVARITARALLEDGNRLEMASFLDREPATIAGLKSTFAAGSKLRFAATCHAAAWRCGHFLYDSAGISRAHPLPHLARRPFAIWMHGIEVWHGLRPGAARRLKRAGLLLVNSRFTLERYRELHGDVANAHVCWLGTEDDAAPECGPSRAGPPAVLVLGRIDADANYKGQLELIAAWPQVVAAEPGARLLIAGGGSGLELIRSAARASPVADRIDVLGFVPEADLPALWQRAHIFAMPSRKEGFGLVYAEAMRHSLPVIATVHDAGPEVNIDGETGYNVSLDRRGELAERLIQLVRDPDLARRMGQAGHRRWREHFSFSAFKRRFLPLFRAFSAQP